MKTKQIFILSILIGLLASVGMTARAMSKELENQVHIASEVIRFHVRANSDSEEDQQLKMTVKKAVLEEMQPMLAQADSVEESREILTQNLGHINQKAKEVLEEKGSEYEVTTYMTNERFPVKVYGDLVFPPGEYEALRIDIGEADGKNWWCVMYPALCFIDETYGILPDESKEKLEEALTEEEFESLKPKVKFKTIELLRSVYTK